MDDTVLRIHHTEVGQTEIGGVLSQSVYLVAGNRVFNWFVLVVGWGVVVWHADYLVWTEALQATFAHSCKSLR